VKTIEAYECQFCHKKLFDKKEMEQHEKTCSDKRRSRLITVVYRKEKGWRYSISEGSPVCIIKKKLPYIDGRITIEEVSDNPHRVSVFYYIIADPKEISLMETLDNLVKHLHTSLIVHVDREFAREFLDFVSEVKKEIKHKKED
jgi:protein associated with RNAse G/E